MRLFKAEPRLRVAALALATAAACLRLPLALSSSFWQDEVASARVIQQPTLGSMVHQVVRTESTPPLWYALAWTLHRAGISIHDVRLLSVFLDGLVVAGVVVLAGRMLPLPLAVAAGAVAAVAAQLSAHGRELRAYELLAVLALALAACLVEAVRMPTVPGLFLLAVTIAGGLLTHYFFAFSVAAAILWVAVEPAARAARRRVLAAIAAGCALAAPWSPWFLVQYRADRYSWIGAFSGHGVLATPLRILDPQLASPATDWLLIGWFALAAVVAARTSARARLCAFLALVPIALAALTWLVGVRVYATRNLIGTAPFLVVLLVVPLIRLHPTRRVAAAAALVTLLAVTYAANQMRPAVPYKGLAAALVADGWRQTSDVAVVGGAHALKSPLEWYLPGGPRLVRRPPPLRRELQVFAVLGAHSPARSAIHGAIHVGGWLVGRLPARTLSRAGTGLTLFVPTSSRERRELQRVATQGSADRRARLLLATRRSGASGAARR
jgi:hypothetical protein